MDAKRKAQTEQTWPLPATKFYMPPVRPTLVTRPRLLKRLDRGLHLGHRLLLVTAPAGYGKTTLAATWLAGYQTKNPQTASMAWLSLAEEDNDPLRFFACIIDALRRNSLNIGQRVEDRLQRSPTASEAWGLMLIKELADPLKTLPKPPILVLDDYQRIQNPIIHEQMAFLVEHLPSSLHLLLLTREDPPLPLARWRVQNQMTELRARDLRFSADEASEFLNQMMGLDLPPERVALLEARTEGWIAGLQLAALSLQDHADPDGFVQSFAGDDRQVVDYLVAEVLAHQTEDVQRFLLQTSILNSMCADLCAELCTDLTEIDTQPNPHSPGPITQSLLEELDRRNLFLVPLDNRRCWYRYHHLFADLLRHHLYADTEAEAIAQLHRRAAHWYAQHDHPAEAVEHALAAEDLNLAADFIEDALATGATWSTGDVGTWQTWWRSLPDRALHKRPWLSLRISRALYLAGHIDQAEHLLDEVDHTLQETPDLVDDAADLSAQVTVYRAAIAAMRGKIREAIQDVHRALNRLPERETLVRARAYDTLGMAYELRGELEEANWAYLEAATLAQQAGVLYLEINALCEAAMIQILQGQLQQARQTCQSTINLIAPENTDLAPLGLAWSVMGEILRQQNDLDQATHALQKGMDLSQQGDISDDLRYEYLFLARLCQSQGDFAGGLAALQQVDLLLQEYHVPRLSDLAAAHRVRLWLAQGQIETARRWAEGYARVTQPEYLREYEDLTLARVLRVTGRPAEASSLLGGLLTAAETGGRLAHVIEALALLALVHQDQADEDGALNALARALSLGAPQGYVRVFLDEGAPMTRLLYQAVKRDIMPEYSARLLSIAAGDTAQASPFTPSSTQPTANDQPLLDPLTDRELEVLALLAERLTNAEICRRLVISLPTVKSHTSNIYTKLGVDNRRAAVAQARTLGILS